MDRTSLVILGMHRAGTSALARVLSLHGAHLPRHVLPANAGNVRGYWEPEAVVRLNDRVLADFGLCWDDPSALALLPEDAAGYAAFLPEARAVLQEEFGSAPLAVMKDPRCTLLQPLWRDALRAEGVRPAWVVMMRPWAEVADSLARRDGSSLEGATLLYIAHGLAAARSVADGASCLTYAQLLADWRGATARIAREQGLQWPREPDAGAIEAYLQAAAPQRGPAAVPTGMAAWADAVWQWFERAAHGDAAPLAALDGVRADFSEAMATLGPLLRDRARRLFAARATADDALQARDHAMQVHRDTEARLHRTQADYDALWTRFEPLRLQFEALQADHAGLRADHELLREESEQRQAELFALYQQTDALLRQAQADYAERDLECGSLRAELAALAREADALRAELARILASRSWRLTRPLRAANRLLGGAHAARPAPGGAPAALPAQAAGDREKGARPHAGLRQFLDAEFGTDVADEVVARIERYRLPVPGEGPRGAARLDCAEAEAIGWAQDIAARPSPGAVRDGETPDVSIVIPVYNQAPFTLACLEAVLAHATRFRFEVLVGDDGSQDATAPALAVSLPGVRHVRHAQNLGFVRNCNATAAHARGRHVLFLNNDTLVLPGWLDELIGTLEDEPGIGLAGSKLVYPDGRLQECGAIVWRDGSAWNYGRLGDPRRPEFCYRRDVDYVSGASIALQRALWERLGGFDELFVPAYAEDADLAFRVRALGLRTVVQPLSQLLHFEGISSGTDLGSGAKAYQVDNLRKLRERWADVLAGHRDNADQPELEKERAVARRVLFVDKCTPTPNEDAGSVVADEIMRGLAEAGCKVTFIPEDNFAHVGEPTRALQRRGVETIYHPAFSRMGAFLAARKDPFDVLFLHRFAVGEKHLALLRRRYPAARVLFLNADMHWLREMREAELSGDAAALAAAQDTRDRELAVVSRVDVALVHSDYERALLQEALPQQRIELFPLVQDPADAVAPLDGREGVCFVGGFRHPPNADAIRWFVETAWPRIHAAVPDARLDIVGSHMPAEVRALGEVPGVRALGFVDDLDALLARRRLTIAPLRYGAGAKGKVAASLAQGVPVVCTPMAAEGMLLSPGEDVLVDATPEGLADHVIAVLRDDGLWHRLSAAGVAYARRVTSREQARQRLRALLAAR